MNTDFENALLREPVQAILTCIMSYTTEEQRMVIYEKLGRRVAPIPISLEGEAKTLYPDSNMPVAEVAELHTHNEMQEAQRSAHITAARQYMGEIGTLKEVRDNLWKCFETEKKNHIHFANECEKLQAENERLRKALEEIAQKYADAEVIDDIGQFVFEMGEIATSALKLT